MGQCGCGDFHPQFTLPGPDGSVYALELFTGCHDCRAPPGVVVARLSGEQLDVWEVEHIKELELRPRPEPDGTEPDDWDAKEYRDAFLVTLDVEQFAKHLDLEHDLIEIYRGLSEARGRNP